MVSGKNSLFNFQSIKGLTSWSQLIPKIRSTSCSNDVTVKSILVVKPAVTTGMSSTLPRERIFCPSPNSRKVCSFTVDNPNGLMALTEIKPLVAPLSIKARIGCPKIRAGTTNKTPSSIFLEFVLFSMVLAFPILWAQLTHCCCPGAAPC